MTAPLHIITHRDEACVVCHYRKGEDGPLTSIAVPMGPIPWARKKVDAYIFGTDETVRLRPKWVHRIQQGKIVQTPGVHIIPQLQPG